jgi:hypothetical protein
LQIINCHNKYLQLVTIIDANIIVKTSELVKYSEVNKMKNMMRSNDDCFRCCLAEFFDIPYEDVPDFFSFDAEEKYTYAENMQRFEMWLEEHGYCYLMIRCDSQYGMPFIGYGNIKVIASLKKKERKYSHAVILHTDDNGDSWYISDPKPDTDYTFDDLVGVDIFIKCPEVSK